MVMVLIEIRVKCGKNNNGGGGMVVMTVLVVVIVVMMGMERRAKNDKTERDR